jgi:hypothetical protein
MRLLEGLHVGPRLTREATKRTWCTPTARESRAACEVNTVVRESALASDQSCVVRPSAPITARDLSQSQLPKGLPSAPNALPVE